MWRGAAGFRGREAFLQEFIFTIKDGKHHLLQVVPKEQTIVPAACHMA